MKKRLFALAVPLAVCAVAAAGQPDKTTSAWWGDIRILASDEFQGRLTGSPGYRKAADYVAQQFGQSGLKPAGTEGYFQSVGFEVQLIDTAHTRVELAAEGSPSAQDISAALVLSPSVPQRSDTHAPLVFAGNGIHLPEVGYDDFAGLDVRGAVVVILVGGPKSVTGPQRAHALSEALPHYLEEAGAVGLITITAPKNREVPWERQVAAGTQPGMVLSEKSLRRYQGLMLAGSFDETKAEVLFGKSGHTFADMVALAQDHRPLPRFALHESVTAHVEAKLSQVTSDNVVAELPGSDPAVAAEAVVLTAHLDHLGTAKPDHGDGIFRGAMDDASGVASLIEIARSMAAAKVKPRRSIVFLAVCGEEKGLLGSRYFAAHPSRHAGHLVADINIDMFLPLYPLEDVVGFGADETSLGDDVRALVQRVGVNLVADPAPDHLVFVRADQYSFVRKGIPAIMLAMNPRGATQQAAYDEWFSKRYHAQADDLNQPVDLAAADAFDRLVGRLVMRVADAQAAPHWRPASFFAKYAAHPLP